MGKILRIAIIFQLLGILTLVHMTRSLAEPSLEDTRKLLQKSLTIYELDQEIDRLTRQQTDTAAKIAETSKQIAVQDKQVAETRQHAGKVVRAYYMGERSSIWMLLFSAKSFSDALSVYEYLSMILENDKRSLTSYQTAYADLQKLQTQLNQTQTELSKVKDEFIAQRDRAVALQNDLDKQIAAIPVAEVQAVKNQIADFTAEWKAKGVPLFRSYLQAISEAMQYLPELLSGDNGKKYLKGLTFQISDTELNGFFRTKNKLFENIDFHFQDGNFGVTGNEGDIRVGIKGNYTVENDPVNKMQFHVNELTYNGFVLPDTSNRSLEQEFDLGFTPGKYVPLLQVTNVTTENGLLTIGVKIKLK